MAETYQMILYLQFLFVEDMYQMLKRIYLEKFITRGKFRP